MTLVRASLSCSHLEIGCERVWQAHVPWKGTENQVPHLDTVGRYDVTETKMVITQELWEIVQQDKQHSQGSLWIGREIPPDKK